MPCKILRLRSDFDVILKGRLFDSIYQADYSHESIQVKFWHEKRSLGRGGKILTAMVPGLNDTLTESVKCVRPRLLKGGTKVTAQPINSLLENFSRTAEEYFLLDEFKARLASGKPLRIKYGVDVTAPCLHIGHAVNLWMMRTMQDLGHKVVFLIGDFTTRIGDPTGKSQTRPILPLEEIESNTARFLEQAKMILRFDNPDLIEVRRNSEWWGSMPISELLSLLSVMTHSKLIARDMFQRRIDVREEIYMHELLYPVLQGYDSFAIHSDLTIIGSDQLFNEMLGRFYQEKLGQHPQVIITTKITPGIDGKEKQSKSLGNFIGLAHSPRDKYGRIMRLPDNLITTYLRNYTNVSLETVDEIEELVKREPMKWKMFLAREIVKRYHGEKIASEEDQWFERTFSQRMVPTHIPSIEMTNSIVSAVELVQVLNPEKSKSEAKRLIQQGALTVADTNVTDPQQDIAVVKDLVVKIGKRQWYQINPK